MIWDTTSHVARLPNLHIHLPRVLVARLTCVSLFTPISAISRPQSWRLFTKEAMHFTSRVQRQHLCVHPLLAVLRWEPTSPSPVSGRIPLDVPSHTGRANIALYEKRFQSNLPRWMLPPLPAL